MDKICEVIGPGGKMIRSIVDETGVKIDVEDDGTVKIFSTTGTAAAGGGPFQCVLMPCYATARLHCTEVRDRPVPSQHPSKPRRHPEPCQPYLAAGATKG